MVICRIGGRAAVFAALATVLVWTSDARAAADWEWTANQGWVMGAGVSRPTPREQLSYAYELEQKGEFMDAARQYFLLVQNFPDSEEAGVGLQRLARCLFEMENYYTSYNAIEQVIKTYPNTGRMSDLVEIELRIAKRMMLSQTPDILADRESSNRDYNVRRALEIVNSVIEHDPYGPVAAEAYLVKGEGNLFINEIATARTAFETVRDEFPRSDFVERARLGILRCDSLIGQARPQELAEQAEVVREEEARRHSQAQASEYDEFDDVEQSLRGMAEVEAAKMMEQAEVYRRMGTRPAVKSSEFLYKEIARRYPNTPQAEEALAKLGNMRVPAEESRLWKGVRNLNLNPFTWNKDPEPPWIVPQIDPNDMVMVDSGLGPIAGVPETGPPPTSGSAGVRPAVLANASDASGDLGYSPISAAPAPAFIDGIAGSSGQRVYSSGGMIPPGAGANQYAAAPPPAFVDLEPVRGSSFLSTNNPLPSIAESDLISLDGVGPASASNAGIPYPASSYQAAPSYPAPNYSPPPTAPGYSGSQSPLNLGGLDYDAAMSDLVGPAPRSVYSASQPSPSYFVPAPANPAYPANGGYYSTQPEQPTTVYPGSTYDPASGGLPVQGYSTSSQGGWTLGEDFR